MKHSHPQTLIAANEESKRATFLGGGTSTKEVAQIFPQINLSLSLALSLSLSPGRGKQLFLGAGKLS